jgi:hypothetical protein
MVFITKAVHHPLMLGIAGEHMVCADLLLAGYRAFQATQACHYDVVVESKIGLLRLQVKTTGGIRCVFPPSLAKFNPRPVYFWHVKRRGRNLAKTYNPEDFDILALVAADIKRIAYILPPVHANSVSVRAHDDPGPQMPRPGRSKPSGKSGRVFSACTFENAVNELLRARNV